MLLIQASELFFTVLSFSVPLRRLSRIVLLALRSSSTAGYIGKRLLAIASLSGDKFSTTITDTPPIIPANCNDDKVYSNDEDDRVIETGKGRKNGAGKTTRGLRAECVVL